MLELARHVLSRIGDDPYGFAARLLVSCQVLSKLLPGWLPLLSGTLMTAGVSAGLKPLERRVVNESVYPSYRSFAVADMVMFLAMAAYLVYHAFTRSPKTRRAPVRRLACAAATAALANLAHGLAYAEALRRLDSDEYRRAQDGLHGVILLATAVVYAVLSYTMEPQWSADMRAVQRGQDRAASELEELRAKMDDMQRTVAEMVGENAALRTEMSYLDGGKPPSPRKEMGAFGGGGRVPAGR